MILILYTALFFMMVTSMVLLRNRFEFESISNQPIINLLPEPKVSICIPARNEENVISKCVESMLSQNYSNFEVLVLDDNSEDGTSIILQHLAHNHQKLNVLEGEPKPIDWLGKPWACHQLSKKANGDLLIFIDADVWTEHDTIAKIVSKIENYDALTIWPEQKVYGFLEQLIVPTVYYALLTLLPTIYVERSPRWIPTFIRTHLDQKFVAACGQCLAFKKRAYQSINGHESVKDQIVEDVELARKLKENGLALSMCNGIHSMYCRMYTSGSEIWQGFQKNFYAGFSNPFEFLLMAIIHFLFFLFPIFTFLLSITDKNEVIFTLSILIIAIYTTQRALLNHWFKWNWWVAMLHPISVIWFQCLGIKCVYNKFFRIKSIWKGRQV
jgi:chlorobactene glucosyltransferase